jgi:hypothetical protein
MGPWKRSLVTVQIVCDADGKLTAETVRIHSERYPRRDKIDPPDPTSGQVLGTHDGTIANAAELVSWLGTLPVSDDELVHLRIVPIGTPAQRRILVELPWVNAVPLAVVSFPRGKAPTRSALRVPLVLSSTGDKKFVDERREALTFKLAAQGDIVLAREGDAISKAVSARTRLVILETNKLSTPPDGAFNVLQVRGNDTQRIAFVQQVLRSVFHDAPLDAAVFEALTESGIDRSNIRFDLFDRDEHCLRVTVALHQAATNLKQAVKYLPKNGGSMPKAIPLPSPSPVLESLVPDAGVTLDDWADHVSSHAIAPGITPGAAADVLGQASPALDVAEAAVAAADQVELDRSAQMWLENAAEQEVPAESPLTELGEYYLNFELAKEIHSTATSARLPSDQLRAYFATSNKLDLDIVFYADPAYLRIDGYRFELTLQRWGATPIIRTKLVPLKKGVHQVRACVFYKGTMLQSLALQVGVEQPGKPAVVDYTGVDTFQGITRLPQVAYSLWINDTGDKHWIGVYTTKDALSDLEPFALETPSTTAVSQAVAPTRKALALLEGDDGTANAAYLFSAELTASDELTKEQDARFIELAKAGYRMFTAMMQPSDTPDDDYVPKLKKRLKTADQILSIARLDDQSSVPWALIYDQRIDPADPNLTACPRYKRTQPDGTKLVHSPSACREQADCPLKSADTLRQTVCPFGFWGFRHQIELRLANQTGGVNAVDRTRIKSVDKPPAAAAMFDFPESPAHLASLGALVDAGEPLKDRNKVLAALRAGDRSLYYFFCHADQDEGVHLRIAPGQLIEPASIAARFEAEDDGWELSKWSVQRPLVFLNACQSIALDAQLISPFLDKFFGLGASGLVGTEVRVFTELAASLATALLTRMITNHESLGTALLQVRREMLGNGNPMGLAYAVYGSAALHFHREKNCNCEVKP